MMERQGRGGRRTEYYDQPVAVNNALLHTLKLQDGLFLANHHATKEEDFLKNNKIGIVLTTAHNKPCIVPTLHYQFSRKSDSPAVNIPQLIEVIRRIDEMTRECLGCIVVSKSIDSKNVSLGVLYLMVKYGLSLIECLEYLRVKSKDIKIGTSYVRMLESFDRSKDRDRVERLCGRKTDEQINLLKNTIANSATLNMPNFHGLSHKSDTIEVNFKESPIKKVKFAEEETYIPSHVHQERYISTEDSTPLLPESQLKQFIRDNCQPIVATKTSMSSQPEVNFSHKSKVVRRLPRKRAVSKTEASDGDIQMEKSQLVTQKNNYIDWSSRNQTQQFLDTPLPLGKSRQASSRWSHFNDKRSTISQNEREKPYRNKKTNTEQSSQADILDQPAIKTAMNLFKIYKSNKNSTNKLKTHQPSISKKSKDQVIHFIIKEGLSFGFTKDTASLSHLAGDKDKSIEERQGSRAPRSTHQKRPSEKQGWQ